MIQTLARPNNLRLFRPEHFEYVVVDEFHHSMANSYRRVIDYLKPRFLLGLTATPERMDGRDVLSLCDYNIALELRLLAAVGKGLLAPFQYYAIYDETDYEQIIWRGTHYDEEQLDAALKNDTRTATVANNLRKFLPSSGKIKALAFCSSVSHARYTANRLTREHGIEALPLLGGSATEDRAAAIRRLEDENDPLQVICAVDIFNEGIDIPSLTHILFLRPTQSFTVFLQQLGRGLRKASGKDFLVAIDLVGNFRKAHVAPLVFSGYTSVNEYLEDRRAALIAPSLDSRLPDGCYINADIEAQRIWNHEFTSISRFSNEERLKALYLEIKDDLDGRSPGLMDFLANSHNVDPHEFVLHFGGWLRAKLACEGGDLPPAEKRVLGTRGEAFLTYLEKDLSPTRSFKMVVLKALLSMPGTSWNVEDIAKEFLGYFLDNPDKLFDFKALARNQKPSDYPLKRVVAHIKQMPLHFLSNKKTDWFTLDSDANVFRLKPEIHSFWLDESFRELVSDRVEYALARYFYRRGARGPVLYDQRILGEGFPVDAAFVQRVLSGGRAGPQSISLKPAEAIEISLLLSGQKYKATIIRKEIGGEYWVTYPGNQGLIDALRPLVEGKEQKGKRVFILTPEDRNTLAVHPGSDQGYAVTVPYAKNADSGYTKQFREILRKSPEAASWEMEFEKSGYGGEMDLDIMEGDTFLAWTQLTYDDVTRFPQRIKAVATALFAEGRRGKYHAQAKALQVRISKKQA